MSALRHEPSFHNQHNVNDGSRRFARRGFECHVSRMKSQEIAIWRAKSRHMVAGVRVGQNSQNQPIVIPAIIELGTWRLRPPPTPFRFPAAFEIVAPRPLSSLLDI